MTDKPGGRGGRRPGAGRKPRPDSPPKESRRISLGPELWKKIDTAQEALGLTRTEIFEAMSEAWLAANHTRDNN